MAITDELREELATCVKNNWMTTATRKEFLAIADHIDAEHESKISRAAQLLADAEKDRDFSYANWQDCKQKVLQHNITIDELDAEIERLKDGLARCIALPVDADGEYIHVGDVMDSRVDYLFDGKPFTVRALVLCEDGWEAADGRFGNRYEPDSLHHHHAPTVEDVLEELLLEYDRDDSELTNGEIIERFAARLRLAEGDE